MRRKLLLMMFLLTFQLITAQSDTSVTLNLQNTPVPDALEEIERQTGLHFFFIEEWVSDLTISGNFEQVAVEKVLEQIFENTLINYFFMQGERVVLIRNVLIYGELPEGYFEIQNAVVQAYESEEEATPVFSGAKKASESKELGTVRIGKETRENRRKFFTLSGKITDKETGDPLSGVALVVEGKPNLGAVTDVEGNYEIRLPAGENILESKSIMTESYKKRVIVFNDGQMDIALGESLEMLGEVMLDANARSNVKEANTGVEQINVREIKNIPLVLGERDILKVATTLPGISTAGEGSSGFNVRGGKADQNLILLDDAVIYNPSHFFGLFSALNPFTSGDVKIYKGNMPAEYGGRLSSVFDIRTRDASTQKFGGEASIGPVTGNLTLEMPVIKDKAGLMVGGRSTYSDWILRSLDEESLKNSTATFFDVIAKYNHIINNKNEFEATGYFSRDKFSITSDSLFSYNNRLATLRYNRSLNEKNRGSIILSNSDYQFNIDYAGYLGNNNFSSGYRINETELKINLTHLYSAAHRFDYGVSSKLYIVSPGDVEPLDEESVVQALSIPQEKGVESAAYFTDNFTVNEKLLINTGVRYSFYAAVGEGIVNVYEKGVPKSEASLIDREEYGANEVMETYGGLEGRISARYFLLPNLSAKASFNNTYQYIHTLTNNTTMSPTDTYKLSDANIEPQRGNQYTLGLYKNFDSNLYELSVEGYYKTTRNTLDFKVGAQLFLNEDIETEVLQGKGRAYGIEFLLKKSRGALNGWVGYSYNRSLLKLDGDFNEEQVNGGEYFPSNFDKPHDFSFVGNYKMTKRFSFSANFVYQTGRPVTFPVGKYIFNGSEYVHYSDRNEFRIPDYYRLDLSLNIEGNHKIAKLAHSFWNISVYNVLGRNNPYSVFFITEGGEVKALQSSIFSIPVPTITYNLKF
ncbi:carboxypeptidase-like regulatory domain-containing protein [Salinimicrobium sp. TH3]|uniref:carboxypeptidase-like regulatory domain-containing protein n=1 Tax=Salinimicrobium sp. TH3 TaxID=2997342 RepID=UPI0022750A82|nr:carboxypeptidase-like regulatory domain-containing protein [Salinimicrobium sp. TH3]MCY2687294.1 TonB-dependent receptor [Salinimicrobium sp. TH3]